MVNLNVVDKNYTEMLRSLFELLGMSFEETTELQRQLLAAFSFGMLSRDSQDKKLPIEQAYENSRFMLIDIFGYSKVQASDFTDFLVNVASDRSIHSTIHVVIKRGEQGYVQFKGNKNLDLKNNIEEILNEVAKG
ncbi:Imm48 family immunity protein [uncultured Shewanella sp.]|uniref:Imm48 family immunity protein n=1 Tax=uncultured Shewanella sp. TaxID=173975 RepID=UPI002619BF0A|nr:Imm48 family immunity protein [uncultured Shewanella sp.]